MIRLPLLERDMWEEILQTLTRNKTRSLLTAFGIFWGVFMLLLMMGGGNGLKTALGQVFSGFASNTGLITSMGTTSEPYKGFQKGRRWTLEFNDIARIKNNVPELDVVTAMNGRGGTAHYQSKKSTVNLSGVYPEYFQIENPIIGEGRSLNHSDLLQERKVCIIGQRVQENLFGDSIPAIGQSIEIDGIYYQVVGVSHRGNNGISINGMPSERVTIPYTTMQRVYNTGKAVDLLCFTAKEGYTISEVQDKVEKIIKRAHTIHPDDNTALMRVNVEELFNMVNDLFRGISALVWIVGIGTLLGGAIGVSNIMMVTIRERTTEIGIRRAIGAKPWDITLQVLSETIVLTLVAGMSGITLAVLGLQLAEMNMPPEIEGAEFQISFWTAISAALLLSLLGIIAGLAPAYRAMSIRPVDAMRDE